MIQTKKRTTRRKKAIQKLGVKPNVFAEAGDFWRFRFLAERMMHDKTLTLLNEEILKKHELSKKIGRLQEHIADLEIRTSQRVLGAQRDEQDASLSEYNKERGKFESKYNIDLTKDEIVEDTLEIIKK